MYTFIIGIFLIPILVAAFLYWFASQRKLFRVRQIKKYAGTASSKEIIWLHNRSGHGYQSLSIWFKKCMEFRNRKVVLLMKEMKKVVLETYYEFYPPKIDKSKPVTKTTKRKAVTEKEKKIVEEAIKDSITKIPTDDGRQKTRRVPLVFKPMRKAVADLERDKACFKERCDSFEGGFKTEAMLEKAAKLEKDFGNEQTV